MMQHQQQSTLVMQAPRRGVWSESEHERFLQALKLYPVGPWRAITLFVGTRSIKQVQTHAQKYQEKLARLQRGLRKQSKIVERVGHRVDESAMKMATRFRRSRMEDDEIEIMLPLAPTLTPSLLHMPAINMSMGMQDQQEDVPPMPLPMPTAIKIESFDAAFAPIDMDAGMAIDPLPYAALEAELALDSMWACESLSEPLDLFL